MQFPRQGKGEPAASQGLLLWTYHDDLAYASRHLDGGTLRCNGAFKSISKLTTRYYSAFSITAITRVARTDLGRRQIASNTQKGRPTCQDDRPLLSSHTIMCTYANRFRRCYARV